MVTLHLPVRARDFYPDIRTYRLSGGRRRALRWAPPPTRHRRSGGIEPTRPRGGKGAPAGGTGGGKDGQHTEVGSRLHVTTTDSRTGQISLGDGGGHRLASWTSGYATARSEAICRGAGCGRTRTSGSVGGRGQQRPWSTRPSDTGAPLELSGLTSGLYGSRMSRAATAATFGAVIGQKLTTHRRSSTGHPLQCVRTHSAGKRPIKFPSQRLAPAAMAA